MNLQMDEKRCGHCRKIKKLSQFYKNSRNKDKKDTWCKECRSAYKKELRSTNREWQNSRDRELYAAKRDGVEPSKIVGRTKREVTGDGPKDLAIAILERARLDLEGSYVIIRGKKQDDELMGAAREDALAWFRQSEQCERFLEWLNIRTDLTYLVRKCAYD